MTEPIPPVQAVQRADLGSWLGPAGCRRIFVTVPLALAVALAVSLMTQPTHYPVSADATRQPHDAVSG
jgi:hypothetical protein